MTDDGIMWLYPFQRKQYVAAAPDHAGGLHGKEFYKQITGSGISRGRVRVDGGRLACELGDVHAGFASSGMMPI
jgi:hypothetical protein